MIKYFLGPMSRNVVDAVLEFENKTKNQIGFIPSRRQVEFDGGYVNNWTTKTFREYAQSSFITRDHSGPGQGLKNDDGYRSLEEDCKYLNMIHVDPWKKYPDFEEGLRHTIDIIKFCYSNNKNLLYEIGTEEAIRKFETEEVEKLITSCQKLLPRNIYEKIDYVVIQSGVGLNLGEMKNTGRFSSDRLSSMIEVCKKHNLKTKEHNGDYLSNNELKLRFDLGLDSINIAPEFGQIETLCYIEALKNTNLFEQFYNVCYNSKRWEKWAKKGFNPHVERERLITICGHYVFSSPEFLEIKPNIDQKIKTTITQKLEKMYEI